MASRAQASTCTEPIALASIQCPQRPVRWRFGALRALDAVRSGRSGLLAGLDLQGDGDLVADDYAAALERHGDVDAEVTAVEDGGGLETGDGTVAHAGVDAVELHGELDGLGHAVQGELTVEDEVGARGAQAGGGESHGGVLLHLEEVCGTDVAVALVVAGGEGVHGDLGGRGGSAVGGYFDGAREGAEGAAHLAHHQVTDAEGHVGVDGVDGPGSGRET